MPGGASVPDDFTPPGSGASPEPSEEIFPLQTITLRFNHKKHVQQLKLNCKECHAAAYTSDSADDRLTPRPAQTCDNCTRRQSLRSQERQSGERPERAVQLLPHRSSTKTVTRGHGASAREHALHPQKAPRTQHPVRPVPRQDRGDGARDPRRAASHGRLLRLPQHERSGSRRRQRARARAAISRSPTAACRRRSPAETLEPPRWLHLAGHTPDWIERHFRRSPRTTAPFFAVRATRRATAPIATTAKVRPRKIHPNDFLSMHPEAARQDNPRCVSCHQLQTFCADCHRRTGVARDVASGRIAKRDRFHPPPSEWTNAPRGPMHHSWEAERNLNACVSCHTERDCATATKGVNGGMGVNPHPMGFQSKCKVMLQRNPRPCLVCHQQGDSSLRMCQ